MGLKTEKGSYWEQLYEAAKIQQRIFSLCFTEQGAVSASGTGAGAMVLGSSGDPRVHQTPIVYAKMIDTTNYDGFVIHIEKSD